MKKDKIRFMRIFVIFLFCIAIAGGQNPGSTGSIGLLHTHSGSVVEKGRFDVTTNINFWSKLVETRDATSDEQAQNATYVAANLALTYGFTRHFDVILSSRLYQDTYYQPKQNNFPDDLFLQLKFGSYEFQRRHFKQAFMIASRFPTGKVHNYPFAEYASGSIEYGIKYAVSFYKNAYVPEKETQVHFNLGWWNHNEKGKEIDVYKSDPMVATVNSNYLQFALATVFPKGNIDFRMELSGGFYLTRPDTFVYSAEDWFYFTPGMRYRFSDVVSMDLGMDFRLNSGDNQYTKGVPDISESLNLSKNYPAWKLHLGFNFILAPGEKKELVKGMDKERYEKRVQYYQLIKEEKKKADAAEDDYDMLRNERQKADDEIESLREVLEEED
jgi:hypothetical protein